MAYKVTMPRLSDTMEEGKIVRWCKAPGDMVLKGEVLLEIETDKSVIDVESEAEGTLLEILAQEGDTLKCGEPIARIG